MIDAASKQVAVANMWKAPSGAATEAWNEELDLMRALSIEAASRTTSRKPSKDSPKPLEGDGEALPPSPRTPELSSLGAEKPSELTNN